MSDFQFKFDEEGQPAAVEVDGDVQEIPESTKDQIPGRTIQEVTDLNTSIRSTVESMKDSYDGDSIIVDIEATHGGYSNRNNYFYLVDGMQDFVDTWYEPYGNPYIANHDLKGEVPMGRVEDAKFVETGKSTGYHALDVEVGHEDEIERILDGRSLTVSVGSVPVRSVECSICEQDLFHDGRASQRFELESEMSEEWLDQQAPGIFGGLFSKTNREFWDYNVTDDGTVTCKCRHIRGIDAPMGDDDTTEIDWFLHGNRYREVSRVNLPADQNEETGEFAHIRGLVEQTDSLENGWEVFESEMSKIEDSSPLEWARHQVVSKDQLYRPSSPSEALDYAQEVDEDSGYFFDTGLWVAINERMAGQSFKDQVEAYHEKGGRFVGPVQEEASTSITELSVEDALQLDPAEFATWLKAQDCSRRMKRVLDKGYRKIEFG